MRRIFDVSRKVIKKFNSINKRNLFGRLLSLQLEYVRINLMLLLRISEFDSYKSLFLVTNNEREKIYCDFGGRMFRFLNN